ncbi:MAG: amidinotransferase, partial [Theionarchaea archaeon]|nr:amidinotransferase [Theionarchaea archaeon]
MMGTLSEVGRIKRIALRHPEQAFQNQEIIDEQWRELNYIERPLYSQAVIEYNKFVELLSRFGMKIDFLPFDEGLTLDSLYVRDATIISHKGVILCNMGKIQRKHEPVVAGKTFSAAGIPVLGAIKEPGQL